MPETLHPMLSGPWQEFSRRQWGVTPVRATYELEGNSARLNALLLLDRRGRVCQPPLCPRFALELSPGGPGQDRASQDWLALAPQLASDFRRRGLHSQIILPAGFTDARPLTWAGLRCGLSYTACLGFPYSIAQAGAGVRRACTKARRAGYRVAYPAPPRDLLVCLQSSAARARFALPLTLAQLETAVSTLTDQVLRLYVCYAPNGEPAAARGVLCAPRHIALDWLTGTIGDHLQGGATQLLVEHVLDDTAAAGASGFDFEGANIPGVAESKLRWGAKLTPLITVEQLSLRNLARDAWRMFKLWRRGAP